jgi:hypothetical protein
MTAILEIFDSTIVAIGAFNPAIFSPDWLAHNNLIGKVDAESSTERDSLVVARQVAVIETDWFVLQVLEDRLTLASKGAVTPMIKDLAVGIMSIIPQTPILALGMNFSGHYKFSTLDEYHKIGDVLAPKNIFSTIFPDRSIGLSNLTIKIQNCKRDEIPKVGDEVNIIVQQSTKIRGGSGIVFTYNVHKDITHKDDESTTSAEYAARLVDTEWDASRERSVEIFNDLIQAALAGQNGPVK